MGKEENVGRDDGFGNCNEREGAGEGDTGSQCGEQRRSSAALIVLYEKCEMKRATSWIV